MNIVLCPNCKTIQKMGTVCSICTCPIKQRVNGGSNNEREREKDDYWGPNNNNKRLVR
jgi:hypothetical protein